MSWTWNTLDSSGAVTDSAAEIITVAAGSPKPEFDSQGDAETFIGETWRMLLAAGVEAVSLYDADTLIYTMPLTPQV